MSYVTSVVIAVTYASPEFEAAVLQESDFGREGSILTALAELDMHAAGGTKLCGHNVFAAGLNYADREALRAWTDALPWSDFMTGVVLVDTEGDHAEVWVYPVPAAVGSEK